MCVAMKPFPYDCLPTMSLFTPCHEGRGWIWGCQPTHWIHTKSQNANYPCITAAQLPGPEFIPLPLSIPPVKNSGKCVGPFLDCALYVLACWNRYRNFKQSRWSDWGLKFSYVRYPPYSHCRGHTLRVSAIGLSYCLLPNYFLNRLKPTFSSQIIWNDNMIQHTPMPIPSNSE